MKNSNNPKKRGVPYLLLMIIFVINFLVMPRIVYDADPQVIMFVTKNLIENHTISAPPPQLGPGNERGQNFYENVKTGRWYSKWGEVNTLMYLPPLVLLHYFHPNKLDNMYQDGVFVLNLYNIFLGLLLAFYLWRLTSIYTKNRIIQSIFILSIYYSTFLWNYLRAQTSEIYQTLFFTVMFYHLIRLKDGFSRKHVLISTLFLGLLCHVRLVYAIFIPVFLFFVLVSGYKQNEKLVSYFFTKFQKHLSDYMLFLFIPIILLCGSVLFMNNYKFGSPFLNGYDQWELTKGMFSGTFFTAFTSFLFNLKYSIFIHFPVLLLSFFGIKAFYRKYSYDTLCIYSFFIVLLLFISSLKVWTGEWCYGPRHLILCLPVLSLPFIDFLCWIDQKRRRFSGLISGITLLAMLLYSSNVQMKINSLHFFAYYNVQSFFNYFTQNKILTEDEVNTYYDGKHFSVVIDDLLKHRDSNLDFPLLLKIRGRIPDDTYDKIRQSLNTYLKPNYYFFQ